MKHIPDIRPITLDDSDAVWQMLYYAAHMDEDDNKTVEDARTDTFLRRYVEDWGRADDLGFIAEIESQCVGAVWIRQFDDQDHPELAIAVIPDVVGQGIGTQLMQKLIAAAKDHHTIITLSVRANNPAYRLYQRLGFEVVDEIVNRVGTKSYEMHLRL